MLLSAACASQTDTAPTSGSTGAKPDSAPLDSRDAGKLAAPLGERATAVVNFAPGPCAGFGKDELPGVVLGAPKGGGTNQGSLDVLSLGAGGSIVLSFAPFDIIDGPGADFTVFENAFQYGAQVFAEPGRVAVSADGTHWTEFPCDPKAAGYPGCAGKTPTLCTDDNGVSDADASVSGGDSFDLAAVGVASARFVRVTDASRADCDSGVESAGFDLDAVSLVHSARIP